MNETELIAWIGNVTKVLNGFRAELDLIHQMNENYLELFRDIVKSLNEIKEKQNQVDNKEKK